MSVCTMQEPILRPLNDRVLIRRIPEPEPGLIVVPEIAREKSWKGEILAVGPGKRDEYGNLSETVVKPGQICYFHGKWNDWPQGPDELVVLQEADIICLVSAS